MPGNLRFRKKIKVCFLSGGSTCFIAVIIMLYHVFGLPSKSRSEKNKKSRISVNRVWQGSNRSRAIHEPKP